MITHVVLLQPKPETTREELAHAFDLVKGLQQHITGILDIQTGENFSANHQGYTAGFIMQFQEREYLKAYAPHPAHRIVSDELVRICPSIIDFDLEQNE